MPKIMRFTNQHTNDVLGDYGFDDMKKLMFDCADNRLEGVTSKEANDKIREVFNNVLGLDENSKPAEIRRATRRHAIDIYEIIEETVPNLLRTGWTENPFFDAFVEYRNGAFGDTNEFYVPDDTILTVSKLSGGHHDLIRQRLGEGQSFSVQTSWYGVKIYAEFEQFMAGRVDWSGFIQKIYEAYDRMMNNMLYDALIGGVNKVTPSAAFIKTGKLDSTTVDNFLELVENVEAATGEDVTIVGSKAALAKLTKVTPAEWISNEMKQERHTTGRLGIWEGTPLMEIKQGFKDKTYTTKLVANDTLLVVPSSDNKFIKVYDEGDAQIYQHSDGSGNMDMTIDYEYQQKMGIATVLNTKIGSYKIAQ